MAEISQTVESMGDKRKMITCLWIMAITNCIGLLLEIINIIFTFYFTLKSERRSVENNKVLSSIQWGYNDCTLKLNSLEGRVNKLYNSKESKSNMSDKRKHMEEKKNKTKSNKQPKIHEYR